MKRHRKAARLRFCSFTLSLRYVDETLRCISLQKRALGHEEKSKDDPDEKIRGLNEETWVIGALLVQNSMNTVHAFCIDTAKDSSLSGVAWSCS